MEEMQKYNIAMNSSNKGLPFTNGGKKSVPQEECFENLNEMDPEFEGKIRKSFEKLHRILVKRNITLFNIFETFDLDKNGFLTQE